MAGVLDKYRRFVVDDRPVVTGIVAVGDAWACTNPSAGRGISVGTVHAQRLRDAVRDGCDDAESLVLRFDELTERDVTPFYRNQIRSDRARIAEMDALRAGEEPPPPDPTVAALAAAAPRDPDVFRAFLEMLTCLALPEEVMARPGFLDKVQAHAGEPPLIPPGPDRAELESLMADRTRCLATGLSRRGPRRARGCEARGRRSSSRCAFASRASRPRAAGVRRTCTTRPSEGSATRVTYPAASARSISSTALFCRSTRCSATSLTVGPLGSVWPRTARRSWCCAGLSPAARACCSLQWRKRRSSVRNSRSVP